jgi:hypothetical protein
MPRKLRSSRERPDFLPTISRKSCDREATLRERPEITRAVEQVATGLGYTLQNGVDEHALREWYLNYQNHTGKPDRIQIEVNFLMRACALAPKVLAAAALAEAPPCQFLILETEELFGGKINAMVDRRHPRDLYDLFRFTKTNLKHNPEVLRKVAVLFASTMDRDLRTYTMDRFEAIVPKELERLLYPLLRANDRPTAPEMLKAVASRYGPRPQARSRVPRSHGSRTLSAGIALPDQAVIVGRIRQHPALLWKADNVGRHLSRSKKNS